MDENSLLGLRSLVPGILEAHVDSYTSCCLDSKPICPLLKLV